jgi:hypothetical protein
MGAPLLIVIQTEDPMPTDRVSGAIGRLRFPVDRRRGRRPEPPDAGKAVGAYPPMPVPIGPGGTR